MKPAPQDLYCEQCNEPATGNDWIEALQEVICPRCVEAMLAAHPEEQEL
jgi:formylmethanofuran dehydrogenase subunit E